MRDQENGGEGGDVEGWRAAESSIIEGNLAAAERTIASFYPARVSGFVVDSITLRCSWRNESLPAVKTSCPSSFFLSGQALLTFTTSTSVHPVCVAVI